MGRPRHSTPALRMSAPSRQASRSAATSSAVMSPAEPRASSAGHRAGDAQRRPLVGVLELVQLHDPLDVGEAAAAELDVGARVGATRQPLALHPGLEGADVAHLRGRRCRPPASAAGRSSSRKARRGLAGRRSGVARSSAWNSHVRAQRS